MNEGLAVRPRALVTGGARRVGRAIALALARAGCDVDITYRASNDEAAVTAAAIASLGVRCETARLELDDPAGVSAFAASYRSRHETLDALVHNASLYFPTTLEDVDAETAVRIMRVNAIGPLLLSAGLAPALRRSTLAIGGAIVCMCDMHAMGRPRRRFSAYSMSKAALVEMVRSLALDLAPEIRVSGVGPGVVAFPEEGHESDESMQEHYLSRVPLKRAGTVEDAADLVRFLALEAGYITGEVIRLDGGRWLA